MRVLPFFLAVFLVSLLVISQPALAKESNATSSAVKLVAPDGLCDLPNTAIGQRIFANLKAGQSTAGNVLMAVYLTCDDTDLVLKGEEPAMSRYSVVSTTLRHTGYMSRQELIDSVKREMPTLNSQDMSDAITSSANNLINGSSIERFDMPDDVPFKVIRQDENGLYVLNRAVHHMRDGSQQTIIGLFGITAMAGKPVFAYFYDTHPQPDSPLRLTQETVDYLEKLDGLNPAMPVPATPSHE